MRLGIMRLNLSHIPKILQLKQEQEEGEERGGVSFGILYPI